MKPKSWLQAASYSTPDSISFVDRVQTMHDVLQLPRCRSARTACDDTPCRAAHRDFFGEWARLVDLRPRLLAPERCRRRSFSFCWFAFCAHWSDFISAIDSTPDITTPIPVTTSEGAQPEPFTNASACLRLHGSHFIPPRPSLRRDWSQKSPFATRYSISSSFVANGGETGVPSLTVSQTWNHVASSSFHGR